MSTAKPSNYVTFNENKAKIEEKIKATKGLVVVDFQSPSCGDCRRLASGLPGVAEKNPDVLFLLVNVAEVSNARDEWDIKHIPDVRFYKGNLNCLGNIIEGTHHQVQEKIDELK